MDRVSTVVVCLLLLLVCLVNVAPLRAQCCAWQGGVMPAVGCGCLTTPIAPMGCSAYSAPNWPIAAWETRRHLGALGLPVPLTPGCGNCDGCAATLVAETGCGMPADFSDLSTEKYLQLADWQAAVRQGARNATVRGFGGTQVVSSPCDNDAIRSIVRNTIVQGLNYAGEQGAGGDLTRFQNLIAAGVEDAIVEGFNRTTVSDPKPCPDKDPNESKASKGKSGTPPPPPPAISEKRKTTQELPQNSGTAAIRLAGLRSSSLNKSSKVSTLAEDTFLPPAPLSDLVRQHYAGPQDAATFAARYADVQLVTSGWMVGSTGVVPLTGDHGFLVLKLRDDLDYVEVWSRGVLVADKCHYLQYFEDAKRFQEQNSNLH